MNRILILSGPTHEYIDPVRFIGNASSGLMGMHIAEEAQKRNFDIDFITGPIPVQNIPTINESSKIYTITSAQEMLTKVKKIFSNKHKIVIFVAAVSDYRPDIKKDNKIKSNNRNLSIKLLPNIDIASQLGSIKNDNQLFIGYSLQESNDYKIAKDKLLKKNLDSIILNSPDCIGSDKGSYIILNRQDTEPLNIGNISKKECAFFIINDLIKRIWKD